MLAIEDEAGQHRFILEGSIYSVGRDADCTIRVRSQFVSRHHATILRLPQQGGGHFYRIVDGDSHGKRSTNGISINGQKIISRNLEDGDVLIFSGGGKPPVRATYRLLEESALLETQPPPASSADRKITMVGHEITEDTVEGGGRPTA